jgi:hypothetical protein
LPGAARPASFGIELTLPAISSRLRPAACRRLNIIAAILEQPVIEKILTHLCLQARAPPRSPARGQALQAA